MKGYWPNTTEFESFESFCKFVENKGLDGAAKDFKAISKALKSTKKLNLYLACGVLIFGGYVLIDSILKVYTDIKFEKVVEQMQNTDESEGEENNE